MEYNRIISITGLGGLFELLSSKSDGAIVRSLEDQQTRFVSSRIHNFSHLESIEVYTIRENINLVDLFKAIKDSGAALPQEKDSAGVKAFFEKVYPDLDYNRIYHSDMKKMIRWYNLLNNNNIEFVLPVAESNNVDLHKEETHAEAPKAKEKPAVKESKEREAKEKEAKEKEAPAKKAAAKEAAPKAAAAKEAAPKAKTAKAEAKEEAPKKKAAKPAEEEKKAPKKKS